MPAYDRQADGRTDRRTDRRTDGQTDGIAVASTALAKRRAVKIKNLVKLKKNVKHVQTCHELKT